MKKANKTTTGANIQKNNQHNTEFGEEFASGAKSNQEKKNNGNKSAKKC